MKKLLLIAIAALTFTGCATTQAQNYQFDKSRTYNSSFDDVWDNLVQWHADKNISISNIDKDSGLIVAESSGFSDELASCSSSPLVVQLAKKAKLNTLVQQKDNVKVTVNTQFLQRVSLLDEVQTVPCNSTGVLEKTILDALES